MIYTDIMLCYIYIYIWVRKTSVRPANNTRRYPYCDADGGKKQKITPDVYSAPEKTL